MDVATLVEALVLGLVEGLTEFIPVSSTGHILLLGHFLGFQSTGRAFEVLIQLGAILAILTVYFRRFWLIARALPTSPGARRFVYGILLAFLPAAVLGVLLHGVIKTVLFESPALICTTLLLGGIVLLVVDRLPLKPRRRSAYELSPRLAFGIGICQTVALVPGVSRSGATIVGALLLGVEKRAAAEFSFFLAMPTMVGAFAYDLYKNHAALSLDDGLLIAVGFVAAFVAAILVVRRLLDFVAVRGYAPFGWWRIGVALAGFAGLIYMGELDPIGALGLRNGAAPAEEAGRLVTTTTIRVSDPVGELPIGKPAEEPAPVVEPAPAEVPAADPATLPGTEADAAGDLPPSPAPSVGEEPAPPPATMPAAGAPATAEAPPEAAPAPPAAGGETPAAPESNFFDDRFSVVPPTPPQ